jgi:hypothetical protein
MPKAYETWTVTPHGPIEKLTDNLWRVEAKMPNMGLRRVMTVARKDDGQLVIHNAIALDELEMKELEAWGTPGVLVVPNGAHRLDAKIFSKRYPDMKVVASRGSRKKVEEVVAVSAALDELRKDPKIAFGYVEGTTELEGYMEVTSDDGKSLVLTDALFNMPHQPGFFGFVFRVLGSTGGPRVSGIARMLLVKDKKALAAQFARFAKDSGLRRIIVGHHEVIDASPQAVLEKVAATL